MEGKKSGFSEEDRRTASNTDNGDGTSHRQMLIEFYQKYNPSKVNEVDQTLEKFAGREEEMFRKLRLKYNANPDEVNNRPTEAVAYTVDEGTDAAHQPPSLPPPSVSQVEPMSVVLSGNTSRPDMAVTGGFTVAQTGPDDLQTRMPAGRWSSDLYGCIQDEETCWWSFWCPCLVFSRTSHSFGLAKSTSTCWTFALLLFLVIFALLLSRGATVLLAFILIGGIVWMRINFRGRIRQQLGIQGNTCGDCWVHTFCSCCAIAQEARQSKFQRHPYIDFCTGERIALSSEIDNPNEPGARLTFAEEFHNLSQFSKFVLFLSALVFFVACLFSSFESILVLLLVFAQPFMYMYLVWWRSHREDAVLDIIIKLFAIGFWWTTPVTMILESILQVVLILIFALGLSLDQIMAAEGNGDPEDEQNRKDMQQNLALMILLVFCFSFILAAGVEETMKHLIVRCCQYTHAPRNQYTILVYMMAGALGFATAENIGYVFGFSNKNPIPGVSTFATELIILGLRVLMPVHVICAGIQAINTSKRDLEARNLRLWHILLPAIILHGSFDFVTMCFGVLQYAYSIDSFGYELASLSMTFFVAVCGAIYLYINYKKQEDRIMIGWQRLEDDGTENA